MVGALPPIRHVIAITARDRNKAGLSACEHDQTFSNFLERGRHVMRSRKLQKT
jgi:hypothetical protein